MSCTDAVIRELVESAEPTVGVAKEESVRTGEGVVTAAVGVRDI